MHRYKMHELYDADLVVDAIYEGGRAGNASDDPLSRLIGVSNQGGFRYLGNLNSPNLIVITSSFNDPDWPDSLDRETGILIYYGDNKKPGRALHDTPRYGNKLLREIFNVLHADSTNLKRIPPIFVFGNAGVFRDMIFMGLAVPGASELTAMEDLVAIWKIAKGQRFQNYRASFTILNVARISREWINDIKSGNPFSKNCPQVWREWVSRTCYLPLIAEPSIEYRTKNEQIPLNEHDLKMIQIIYEYFIQSPTTFEKCAAKIAQMMDNNFITFDITRPSRDGGRDAIGFYRIGHGTSAILVDFALEAKCYDLNNSVGVREISRLISRLRHRQFGVLVTTSYLNSQAYRELKEDKHPVIVVSAKDVVEILTCAGISSIDEMKNWLHKNFPK